MTREEAIQRLDQMRMELDLLRSVLTPAKKRKRVKKDYSNKINKQILKMYQDK